MKFLKAAETYNYTKMENLITELQEHGKDGQLITNLSRKFLQQYNVEKIIDILNKTCQTS